MTRTATDPDLYRRVQALEQELRRNQQGVLQGQFDPYNYPPCDYAATGNLNVSGGFGSITDLAPGTAAVVPSGGLRLLLTRQTNPVENGIYEVGTDTIMRRAPEMAEGAVIKNGAQIRVLNGFLFGGSVFVVNTGRDMFVGNAPLTFTRTINSGPDWDSGWLSDSLAAGGGVRTYTHNLALTKPPTHLKMWFSPDQTIMFPVAENRGMGTQDMAATVQAYYHNPSLVQVNLNTINVGVYVSAGTTGVPLFSVYTGVAWANYSTGYWRFYVWR